MVAGRLIVGCWGRFSAFYYLFFYFYSIQQCHYKNRKGEKLKSMKIDNFASNRNKKCTVSKIVRKYSFSINKMYAIYDLHY